MCLSDKFFAALVRVGLDQSPPGLDTLPKKISIFQIFYPEVKLNLIGLGKKYRGQSRDGP